MFIVKFLKRKYFPMKIPLQRIRSDFDLTDERISGR